MIKYIEARKNVEKKTEGEFEINKIHIIKINDISLINSLENLSEKDEDDYECAYYHGFSSDFDGCLFSVDVDRVVAFLNEEIENEYADDDDKENYKLIIKSLNNYKGYDFLMKEATSNEQEK